MKKLGMKVMLGANTSAYNQKMRKSKGLVSQLSTQVMKFGAVMAGAFSVGAVVNFYKASVKAYDVQAKAEAGLLTALKGRVDIQKRLIEQASQLQRKTLFGDEKTIEAMGRLATMIGTDEQAIRKLMPLIQDMSTVMKMDLSAAADLVGKSIGSSTNALSRYGISIEGAVGSSERLESAVTSLTEKFEGQAEVAARTGTGALTQLKMAFGDLQETIGGTSSALTPLITKLTELVQKSDELLKGGKLKKAFELIANPPDWLKRAMMATLPHKALIKGYKEIKKSMDSGWEGGAGLISDYDKTKPVPEDKGIDRSYLKVLRYSPLLNIVIAKQVSVYKELNDQLKKLREQRAAATTRGEIAAINDKEQAIQAEIKALGELSIVRQKIGYDEKPLKRLGPGRLVTTEPTPGLADVGPSLQRNFDLAKKMAEENMIELGGIMRDGLLDAMYSVAEGIGMMISGEMGMQKFFDGILRMFGKFMQTMGGLIMSYGVAMEAFKDAFSNPWVAIAAGIALIAAGALVSGLAKRGPSGAGSYGGSGGYTPGGISNYNNWQTREGIDVHVTGELRGEDIYLANQKQEQRNNRF